MNKNYNEDEMNQSQDSKMQLDNDKIYKKVESQVKSKLLYADFNLQLAFDGKPI